MDTYVRRLTYRLSLPDIERAFVLWVASRTTWTGVADCLAPRWGDANEAHDWRVYADFAQGFNRVRITDGTAHDVNILDEILSEAGASTSRFRSTGWSLRCKHGPWVRGFRAALKVHIGFRLLRCARESNVLLRRLLQCGGQDHRRSLRSNRNSDRDQLRQKHIHTC
jgi:hypothetical protein